MSTAPGVPATTDLMEGIKAKLNDRLRAGFVELIPPEAFEALTDAAIDVFVNGPRHKRFESRREWLGSSDERNTTGQGCYVQFEAPIANNTYDPHFDPNTLPGMVMAELQRLGREHVTKIINEEPKFRQMWDGTSGQSVVEVASEIVGQNADMFVQALFRGIISAAMANTFNAIRQNNQNGMPVIF